MSEVEKYFNKFDKPQQELARQIRALVKAASPELAESLKWGQPIYACRGNVCYISVKANYINLGFYRGSELSGSDITIEGTGKNLRHVKIRNNSPLKTEALTKLVQAAVKLEKV